MRFISKREIENIESILNTIYADVDDFIEFMYSNNMYKEYFLRKEVSMEDATYDEDVFESWNYYNAMVYTETVFDEDTLNLMYIYFKRLVKENEDIRDIYDDFKYSYNGYSDTILNILQYYAKEYFNSNYKSSVFYNNLFSVEDSEDKIGEYFKSKH